jgi:hypothetical protein
MPALTFRTEKDLNKIPPPPWPAHGQKALFVMHYKEAGMGGVDRATDRPRARVVVRVGMAREKIGGLPESGRDPSRCSRPSMASLRWRTSDQSFLPKTRLR